MIDTDHKYPIIRTALIARGEVRAVALLDRLPGTYGFEDSPLNRDEAVWLLDRLQTTVYDFPAV